MEAKSIFKTSGAPTARSMAKSLAIHVFVMAVLMVLPAQALFRSEPPNKELDIVFYRPPEIAVNSRAVSRPMPRGTTEAGSPPGAPAPALKPKPNAPAGPDLAGKAELPPGPEMGSPVEAKPKVGNAGILAYKDKFASLAQDSAVVPLGADARHVAADEVGRPSARSLLTSNAPGSSGGIHLASLSRSGGGPRSQHDRPDHRRRPTKGTRRARSCPYRRRNTDRVRSLQGVVLPAVQPGAAQ